MNHSGLTLETFVLEDPSCLDRESEEEEARKSVFFLQRGSMLCAHPASLAQFPWTQWFAAEVGDVLSQKTVWFSWCYLSGRWALPMQTWLT